MLLKVFHCFILLLSSLLASAQYDAKEITSTVLKRIDEVKTLEMDIVSQERLSDRTTYVKQRLEVNVVPCQLKIKFLEPNNGSMVLYCENKNDNELRYVPNGFPYFNMNLDPLGSLARRNNHHTLFEAGFEYLADILSFETNQNIGMVKIKDDVFKNENVILYEAFHPDFTFIKYKMKDDENVRSLALKKRISEYKILEINKNLSSYDDYTDKEILIPNYYCKQIKIYINKETFLPISVQIYDEKGLLERFDYENVIVNPTFKSDYFNID